MTTCSNMFRRVMAEVLAENAIVRNRICSLGGMMDGVGGIGAMRPWFGEGRVLSTWSWSSPTPVQGHECSGLLSTLRRHRWISTHVHHSKDDVDVDAVVIGAGVVGLAVARELLVGQHAVKDVMVVDAGPSFGTMTSSRNSEVVHAGLYYTPGSMKSRFCVPGRNQLYEYCESKGVSYKKLGKLLVAPTEHEVPKLMSIYATATENGVEDLEFVSKERAGELEPDVSCALAMLSPSSGIVDSHGLMASLESDIVSQGSIVAYNSKVVGGSVSDSVKRLNIQDTMTNETICLTSRLLVNSGGLYAHMISKSLENLKANSIPKIQFVKGSYFSLKAGICHPKLKRLVYPVPSGDGGLGVHATLDLNGFIRFGPDVEWLQDVSNPDVIGYEVDAKRAAFFQNAIHAYCPSLDKESLIEPAYSGVRPKVIQQGDRFGDFVVSGAEQHGIEGLVCLYGIESPGLTSCISIAKHVSLLLHDQLQNYSR